MDLTADRAIYLDLPVSLEPGVVAKRLTLRRGSKDPDSIAGELVSLVESVARPRAMYRECRAKVLGSATVGIGEQVFSSRVLGKLLGDGQMVFPYIITVGPELAEAELPGSDMLKRYWLDTVKSMVVQSAGTAFSKHLQSLYKGQRLTHMNPGEIEDWPVTQQKPLFGLFGDASREIGVTLTDGYMMKPTKSRSGLFFGNDNGFETCRLCTQHRCMGRRAAYDEAAIAAYAV